MVGVGEGIMAPSIQDKIGCVIVGRTAVVGLFGEVISLVKFILR